MGAAACRIGPIYLVPWNRGLSKQVFSMNGNGSGWRTVCPSSLSFSEFLVLISTINCKKDNPLRQTVLPPEPFPFDYSAK